MTKTVHYVTTEGRLADPNNLALILEFHGSQDVREFAGSEPWLPVVEKLFHATAADPSEIDVTTPDDISQQVVYGHGTRRKSFYFLDDLLRLLLDAGFHRVTTSNGHYFVCYFLADQPIADNVRRVKPNFANPLIRYFEADRMVRSIVEYLFKDSEVKFELMD